MKYIIFSFCVFMGGHCFGQWYQNKHVELLVFGLLFLGCGLLSLKIKR